MNFLETATFGILVFTLLGIFFGFALAATARRFYVPINPLVEKVRSLLPSANCGACGFAGCQAYAEAVAEEAQVSPSLCIPGGQTTAEWVAELTGKKPAVVEDRVAVLRCHGTLEYSKQETTYLGIRSCTAAALIFGGPRVCKNACLGLGDCVTACPFDAMAIGPAGIVEIFPEKCTGCGLCIPACPKKILELYPKHHRVELSCVALEKASAVRAKCLVGCTTCQKCVAVCPAQAVTWDGITLHIAHSPCIAFGEACKEACVDICPTFVLHRMKQKPLPEELAKLALPATIQQGEEYARPNL